jgi:hypothetical protein
MSIGIFKTIHQAGPWDKEYPLDGTETLDKSQEDSVALTSPEALKAAHGRKVFVYFNLHKKLWSVKDIKTGRVVAHAKAVAVDQPVFKVSEAGRQRVIAEQRKNVHAGVVGTLNADHTNFAGEGLSRVSYNPYRFGHFYETGTNNPVRRGGRATLSVEERSNPEGKTVRIPHLYVSDPMEKSELPGIFGVLKNG